MALGACLTLPQPLAFSPGKTGDQAGTGAGLCLVHRADTQVCHHLRQLKRGRRIVLGGQVPAEPFQVAAGFGPGEQDAYDLARFGNFASFLAPFKVVMKGHVGIEAEAALGYPPDYGMRFRGLLAVGDGGVPVVKDFLGHAAESVDASSLAYLRCRARTWFLIWDRVMGLPPDVFIHEGARIFANYFLFFLPFPLISPHFVAEVVLPVRATSASEGVLRLAQDERDRAGTRVAPASGGVSDPNAEVPAFAGTSGYPSRDAGCQSRNAGCLTEQTV